MDRFVGTSFKVNLNSNEERSHGLEFNKFEYEGREYEKRWVDEFIKQEYSRIDTLVIGIGIEINKFVKNKL